MATFDLKAQVANLALSDKTVTLKFDENVNILFTEEGYQETYGVFLKEDFSKTLFSGFHFTTVAEAGNTTLDWVDSNLNNVILKSITDTVINNKKMVKINVHREFSFFKTYDSSPEALNEQSLIAKKLDDKVSFSSYCFYNHKYYPARSVTTSVVYSE